MLRIYGLAVASTVAFWYFNPLLIGYRFALEKQEQQIYNVPPVKQEPFYETSYELEKQNFSSLYPLE